MISFSKKLSEFSGNGKSIVLDPLLYSVPRDVEGVLVEEGQPIHTNTGGENDLEEVWLYAMNNSKYPTELTLQWGELVTRRDALPTTSESQQEFLDRYWKPQSDSVGNLNGQVTCPATALSTPEHFASGTVHHKFGDVADVWSDEVKEDSSRLVFVVGWGIGVRSYSVDVDGNATFIDEHKQNSIRRGKIDACGNQMNDCMGNIPDPVKIIGYRISGYGGTKAYTNKLFLVVIHDYAQLVTYSVDDNGYLTMLDNYDDDYINYQEREPRPQGLRDMSCFCSVCGGCSGEGCIQPGSQCDYPSEWPWMPDPNTGETCYPINDIFRKHHYGNDLRYTGISLVYKQDHMDQEAFQSLGPSTAFVCVSAKSRALDEDTKWNSYWGYRHHTWNGEEGGIYLFRIHHNENTDDPHGGIEKVDHEGVPLPPLTEEEEKEVEDTCNLADPLLKLMPDASLVPVLYEGEEIKCVGPVHLTYNYSPLEGGSGPLSRTATGDPDAYFNEENEVRVGDHGHLWHKGKIGRWERTPHTAYWQDSRQAGPPPYYRQATAVGAGELEPYDLDQLPLQGDLWKRDGKWKNDHDYAKGADEDVRHIAPCVFVGTRHDSYIGTISSFYMWTLFNTISTSTWIPKIQVTWAGEIARRYGEEVFGTEGHGDHAYLQHQLTIDQHRFTPKLGAINSIWVDSTTNKAFVSEEEIVLDGGPNENTYDLEPPMYILNPSCGGGFIAQVGPDYAKGRYGMCYGNAMGYRICEFSGSLYSGAREAAEREGITTESTHLAGWGRGCQWGYYLYGRQVPSMMPRYHYHPIMNPRSWSYVSPPTYHPFIYRSYAQPFDPTIWDDFQLGANIWVYEATRLVPGAVRGGRARGLKLIPFEKIFQINNLPFSHAKVWGVFGDGSFLYASGSWIEEVDHAVQSSRHVYGLFVFTVSSTGVLSYVGVVRNADIHTVANDDPNAGPPNEAGITNNRVLGDWMDGNTKSMKSNAWNLSRRSGKLWGDAHFIFAASAVGPGISSMQPNKNNTSIWDDQAINIYKKLPIHSQEDMSITQSISPKTGLSLVTPGILLKNKEKLFAKVTTPDGEDVPEENTQSLYVAINRISQS